MAVTAHRTRNHANMYGFARHARGYDLLSGVLARPLYRRVVADVTDVGLPAGSVVLDVGTGPGRVPRLIAAAYPTVEVEGVDLSPEMIARATSTAKTTSTSNLRFRGRRRRCAAVRRQLRRPRRLHPQPPPLGRPGGRPQRDRPGARSRRTGLDL